MLLTQRLIVLVVALTLALGYWTLSKVSGLLFVIYLTHLMKSHRMKILKGLDRLSFTFAFELMELFRFVMYALLGVLFVPVLVEDLSPVKLRHSCDTMAQEYNCLMVSQAPKI